MKSNWVYIEEVVVYAYLDANGGVLYVGQTYDVATRHGAHRQRSSWFPDAVDFAVISFHRNRTDAMLAERDAIRLLAPRHNIRHNQGRGLAA